MEAPLETIVDILDSKRIPLNSTEREQRISGKNIEQLYPYYGATGQVGLIDGYLFDGEYVLLGEDGVPFLDPMRPKAYRVHGKFWVNNHAHVLKAINGLSDNRLVESYLNVFNYKRFVTGSTRLKLTQAAMRSISIPLPPLNEQKRIADKLDRILARVDACRERLDRIPVILKRFRQAVLAAATSGKLTEEWRNLNKIFTHDLSWKLTEQRAQLWIGRGKYRPAIAAEDIECDEFTNLPDSWIRGTLDQITWSVKDGPHYSPEYRKSGVPFISGGSIKPGKIDLSITKYIDPILHHELCQRCKPEYHDILYTKGGTTGIAAVNTL